MSLSVKAALLGLAVLLAAASAGAQFRERETTAPKDKVLELCATQKYDSILAEFDGLKVRFFCDPFMPPLLLDAPGSVNEKKKPGPAISENLPDCPPTDQAYGLCEMTRLERDLRRKMLEVQEKKSFERARAAQEWAAKEKDGKNEAPAPPPCTPMSEGGINVGMISDILGAHGKLIRVMQVPGDLRLVYQITTAAYYGPMARVQEKALVSVDVLASRSQFPVPVLPDVTLTRDQLFNLCLKDLSLNDLGATPLASILKDSALPHKPGEAKPKMKIPDMDQEGDQPDMGVPGTVNLPQDTPLGPIKLVPAK